MRKGDDMHPRQQPAPPSAETRIGTMLAESYPPATPCPQQHALEAPALPWAPLTFAQVSARTQRQRRHVLPRMFLVLFDVAMITIAFWLAYMLRFDLLHGIAFVGSTTFVQIEPAALIFFEIALTTVMTLMLAMRGLYSLRPNGAYMRQASLFFVASTTCFGLFSAYEFYFSASEASLIDASRAFVVFIWILAALIPFSGRLLLAWFIELGYRVGIGRTRLLVIGAGRTGKLIMQHLAASHALGFQIVGFIHDLETPAKDFGRFKMLGELPDVEAVIQREAIGEVIIALPSSHYQHIAQCISACERQGVTFRLTPDLHNLSLTRVDLITLEGIPMLSVGRVSAAGWQRVGKRMLDVTGSLIGLVIGAPLWVLLAAMIRLDSPGPAIYSQERIGLHGKRFISYKFRSMRVGADAKRADLSAENKAGRGLFKLKNDPRCTRVGRWLRRMSLDEIPQLWNVLRGDMSLIGPRPPLPDEIVNYEEWELRRLDMPPGLTGLWQVRGRSNITFDEMVLMDLFYIENWSLRLDLQILFKTIPVVLFSRGAY